MRNRLCASLLLLVAACHRAPEESRVVTSVAVVPEASAPAAPIAEVLPDASSTAVDASPPSTKLVADEEVGPLLARLSETPGDFPSENYVSNELSLLDVAPALRDPKLEGRAFVGVGPEQSFTYLAMLAPKVSYIVDIRRGNLLEHMFFRACFEAGATRAEFLRALLARSPDALGNESGFSSLDAAFRRAPMDPKLRDEGIARTKALMDRLHVAHTKSDDAAIARIQGAFALHGLTIAYTMAGSQRDYPSLGQTLSMRVGENASFLASEDLYTRVRTLVLENRVLPIVGDFGGKHALRAVGEDMRARGLQLGVFYTSNVEQYLFDGRKHGAFVSSVASMPHDASSRIVRVWFDQGRPHPDQRKYRTTQLTMRVEPFLLRAEKKPFKSYWEVVNEPRE